MIVALQLSTQAHWSLPNFGSQ